MSSARSYDSKSWAKAQKRVRSYLVGPTLTLLTMVIAQSAHSRTLCIDASTLAKATVSISRYFIDGDKGGLTFDGYRATAWFYGSTRYLLSIAHFVDDAPVLPRDEWRMVDIEQQNGRAKLDARLLTVVNAVPEGFALFELREPFPAAESLKLREKPLSKNESVRSVAYLDTLRVAKGRFSEIMSSELIPQNHPFAKVPPGTGLFEMWDIEEPYNARYVLDHGASGSPIVDCDGNVAAVTSSLLTQGTMHLPGKEIRLTTPWGTPNNTASLIQPLFDFALPR